MPTNKYGATIFATSSIFWATSMCYGLNRAFAVTIDFDSQGLFGPSQFSEAGTAQTLDIETSDGNVTLNGGVILTSTTNLPANQTSIYGTASFGNSSLSNPLVISFQDSIDNFFLDILNGNTESIVYTVSDNLGNFASFELPPNLVSGQTQIGFPAAGSQVTVTSELGSSIAFDFLIDNISFNELLPNTLPDPIDEGTQSVPEPISILASLPILGIGALSRRRKCN
ncbi:MAG: hypothetical protein SWY16_11590 [Cyanobacteriota bacterium]|nr:hypothetical protein [Cyanobacteriota bacterium]